MVHAKKMQTTRGRMNFLCKIVANFSLIKFYFFVIFRRKLGIRIKSHFIKLRSLSQPLEEQQDSKN
jgi:hypothetical protein